MANEILNIIPGLQSTALLGQTMRSTRFDIKPKRNAYRNQSKALIRGSMGAMVGIPLIGATSTIIGSYK